MTFRRGCLVPSAGGGGGVAYDTSAIDGNVVQQFKFAEMGQSTIMRMRDDATCFISIEELLVRRRRASSDNDHVGIWMLCF